MDVHTDVENTTWRKIWEHIYTKAQALNEATQIQVAPYDARCYNLSVVRNALPRAEVHLNFSAPNPCLFISFERGKEMIPGMFRVELDGKLVNAAKDADSSPEVLADEILNYLRK